MFWNSFGSERLEKELHGLLPPSISNGIRIIPPPYGVNTAWFGAKLISNVSYFAAWSYFYLFEHWNLLLLLSIMACQFYYLINWKHWSVPRWLQAQLSMVSSELPKYKCCDRRVQFTYIIRHRVCVIWCRLSSRSQVTWCCFVLFRYVLTFVLIQLSNFPAPWCLTKKQFRQKSRLNLLWW